MAPKNDKKNPPAPKAEAAAPNPAPADATPAPKKAGRGNLTEDARKKAVQSRHERSIVNEYVEALKPNPDSDRNKKNAERLAEVEAMLQAGVKKKPIPVFIVDGKTRTRNGTKYEDRPLSAVERAELITEQRALKVAHVGKKARELRDEVIAALPSFAARNGYDRSTLELIGLPVADLDAAGIAPLSKSATA